MAWWHKWSSSWSSAVCPVVAQHVSSGRKGRCCRYGLARGLRSICPDMRATSMPDVSALASATAGEKHERWHGLQWQNHSSFSRKPVTSLSISAEVTPMIRMPFSAATDQIARRR